MVLEVFATLSSFFFQLTNRFLFQKVLNQQVNLKIKLKSILGIDEVVNNLNAFIQSDAWSATELGKIYNSHYSFLLVSDQIRCLIKFVVEKRSARTKYQSSNILDFHLINQRIISFPIN